MGLKGNIRPEIEVKGNVSLPDIIEGKSAYGVAVKNGFKGTEEEWLNSLKNGAGPFAQICLDKSNEALEKSTEALEKSEEANNKYVACVEATENANKVREEIEAGGYIESLKETNKGGKFAIWVGTTEEYKALTEIKTNCLYIKTDDTSMQDIKNQIGSLEKDVESLEKVTVDYIVKQGTDGIWTYEKMASGIAKCWGKYTASEINIAENNYSGFYYSRGFDVQLPFEFISIDDFQVNGGSMDRINFARMFGVTSSTVTFIICGHDETATSANITVYISVEGRWK